MADSNGEGVRPLRVFCSYAHEDEKYRNELYITLQQLERPGLIKTWDDRKLPPGSEWDRSIRKELEEADLVLFLITSDFAASSYCYEVEVERAFERHKEDDLQIFPIVVKPVLWRASRFSSLQALPTPQGEKPVIDWKPRDKAYVIVADAIMKIATEAADAAAESSGCIWAVSEDRTRIQDLVGRDALVRRLTGELAAGHERSIVALVGTGGIGKTSVAVEYAWQRRADYGLVAWLDSEDETKLVLQYAFLAREVGLPATSHAAAQSAFRTWLEEHDDWLLIFDNPTSVEAVRRLLPEKMRGHALITSREHVWDGLGREVSVDALDEDDAVWYVLSGTGSTDSGAAKELAKVTRGVPLALKNAIGTIRGEHISLAEYVERLKGGSAN